MKNKLFLLNSFLLIAACGNTNNNATKFEISTAKNTTDREALLAVKFCVISNDFKEFCRNSNITPRDLDNLSLYFDAMVTRSQTREILEEKFPGNWPLYLKRLLKNGGFSFATFSLDKENILAFKRAEKNSKKVNYYEINNPEIPLRFVKKGEYWFIDFCDILGTDDKKLADRIYASQIRYLKILKFENQFIKSNINKFESFDDFCKATIPEFIEFETNVQNPKAKAGL